ncbi:RND family transporter [Fibrobacter succinogenes]|uniref:efflux RND transporter permease subunit n=1 Tax=Fibrobacter succinogenes TaxID=833 RepID=UPI0015647572|nr:MMPL family transporter [Fibrobacter succinogenes]
MSLPKINIEKINARFGQFGEFLLTHRAILLVAFIVLLAVSVVGMKKIYVEASWDSYFIEGDPMLVETDRFKETFGNDYFVGVLVESDHSILSPDNLKLLRELSNELRDSLSYSDGKATSVVDLEYMLGTEEGMEITQIVPEEIPNDEAGIAEIEKKLAAKPELSKKLISSDRKQSFINVKLRPFPEDSVWKAEGKNAPDMQTGEETAKIIAKEKYASLHPKATGMPYLSFEKLKFIGEEMGRIFIITVIFAIIVMFLVTRSLRGIVSPLITTFAGIIMTFGLVGYLGLYMDATNIMVPVILAFAVSIAYNIHIHSFFRKNMMLTGKRKESVLYAMRETGWSVLFSGLTTIVALLSFLSVMLKPIRSVGILSSIAVGFILLVALTVTPILLSFGKDKKPDAKVLERGDTRMGNLLDKLGNFVLGHAKPIAVIFAVVTAISLYGVTKMEPAFDVERTMGRKVEYVSKMLYVAESEIGSFYSYDLVIDFGTNDKAKEVENLKKLEQLQKYAEKYPLTKRSTSILDIVKDLDRTLNENRQEMYAIPENEEQVAQMLLLYENAGGSEATYWMDYDYRKLRLMVEISSYNSNELQKEIEDLQAYARTLFTDAKVTAVGNLPQFTAMQQYLEVGQMTSFLISVVIVAVLLMIVFGSIRTGLIGMIPNIAPGIFVGGYLGLSNIPLDMMTATLIPMIIGLSVDDTIHFINHGHVEFDRSRDYKDAILKVFRTAGPALVMTTIIMVATFSGFTTSKATQMFNFGFVVFVGLVSALLADLFVTPLLIKKFKIFGK